MSYLVTCCIIWIANFTRVSNKYDFHENYYLILKGKNNVKHFSLDNTAKKQVDDQVKAGNEIESEKDSRVSFDFASESLKKKLPPTGR